MEGFLKTLDQAQTSNTSLDSVERLMNTLLCHWENGKNLAKVVISKREYEYLLPLRFLGQGAYGKVLKVLVPIHDRPYALKLIIEKYTQDFKTIVQREADGYQLIKNLNSPSLLSVPLVKMNSMDHKIEILMEFGIGTLADILTFLKTNNIGYEGLADDLMNQLTEQVDILSKKGIVHRDIKPENVVVIRGIEEVYFKIADFGHTYVPIKDPMNNENYLIEPAGTIPYVCDEIKKALQNNTSHVSMKLEEVDKICVENTVREVRNLNTDYELTKEEYLRSVLGWLIDEEKKKR